MRTTTMEDLCTTKTIDWDTFTDICCHRSDYDHFCKNEDHKEYDAYHYGAECHFSVCPIWTDLDLDNIFVISKNHEAVMVVYSEESSYKVISEQKSKPNSQDFWYVKKVPFVNSLSEMREIAETFEPEE